MAYKHVIRAKTKNLMTDEMFTSAGFTKQPDGSWYVPDSAVLNKNKVMWENTEGIAGPITMSFYGRSSAPYYAGVVQWLVEAVDGTITYRTPTGTSSEWVYGTWTFDSKTVSKVYWVNITGRPLYLRDVMFEWGSTPTPYTPYNYLSSNKRMIKVSNVCQLLDKSKYPATTTLNGVTFTNNGNGVITTTGNASNLGSWLNMFYSNFNITKTHKYLLCGSPAGGSSSTYFMRLIPRIDGDPKDTGEGVIFSAIETAEKYVTLQTLPGSGDNLVWKPQLFDLTEMFGAGHEPATVAEFRQRFPNELYPYSPQCWLTSYKSAVVCKTKNLFDVNNAAPYTFTNDNPPSNRISLKDGIYTTTYNNYNVGSGLRIKDGLVLSPGTYTLSLSVITVGETTPITALTYGFRLYKSDGTKPVTTTYTEKFNSRCSHTFTIPGDCTDIRLYLAPHCDSGQEYVYISLKDIQVEQGSTATSYVPYQHL